MEEKTQSNGSNSPDFTAEPGWGAWFKKNGISLILPIAAVVVLIIGLYMHFGGDKSDGTTSKTPSPSASQQTGGILEVAVVKGDNPTLIMRKAVTKYITDAGQTLTPGQRVFMESKLVAALEGAQISGETYKIEANDIKTVMDAAKALTPGQLASWEKYGRNVKF